jgi:16S rRNA (uracil1498-N3)-methyltransferase
MNNIRLFYDKSLSINFSSKLDKSQSHYIYKVMRVGIGQTFSLFNKNGEWEAKIENYKDQAVDFLVIKKIRSNENNKEIWLAFAPIKLNYLNLMLQKATELGVTKLIPILTERTIVRKINLARINKIVIEAAEQSNRLDIPKIEKLTRFKNFLKENKNTNIIFGDLNTNNVKFDFKDEKPVCVLIGPEGDFTEDERSMILNQKNITSIKINENILRSETAAISMLSLIGFKFLS